MDSFLTTRRELLQRIAQVTAGAVLPASLAPLVGCGSGGADLAVENRLWSQTASVNLRDRMWLNPNAYDAGHVLMVSLHSAYELPMPRWQEAFVDQFHRFMQDRANLDSVILSRVQYLYLASQFALLAAQSDQAASVPAGLPEFLAAEVEAVWLQTPAWIWNRAPFAGGMRERLLWKLAQGQTERRYYRAILDEDLFVVAIAADLRAYENVTNRRLANTTVLDDVLSLAKDALDQRVVRTGRGGMLFQPGVWSDHPDYAYAGQPAKAADLMPAPLSDAAEDTSHSLRWPRWLRSYAGAYLPGSDMRLYYEGLMTALVRQFVDVLAVKPTSDFPAFRTRNYMDGRNGLYRWRPDTQTGYGPYEVSGALTLGWWSFLGSPKIRQMYQDMIGAFPLRANVVATYTGPGSSPEHNPLAAFPAYLVNGYAELNVRLSARR